MDPQPFRLCARCHVAKPVDEFPIKDAARGWRSSYCLPCRRAYGRAHYESNKPYYLAKNHMSRVRNRTVNRDLVYDFLVTHPCVDCGEGDPVLLDFDHVDETTKRWSVGAMLSRRTTSAVRREMSKCVIRCANCHRRRTARQFGFRDPLEPRTPRE